MRKLSILVFILFIFQHTVSAQFNKGSLYIDGNVSIGNYQINPVNNSATYKSSGFNFSPNIGFFIANNLAVGVGFGYQNYSYSNYKKLYESSNTDTLEYKIFSTQTNKLNELSPTLFVKYFYTFNDKLSLSLKVSYAHGWGTAYLEDKTNDSREILDKIILQDTVKIQSDYFMISPMLQYMITPKLGVQVNFNGFRYELTNKYDTEFAAYIPEINHSSAIKINQSTTLLDFDPRMWSFGVFFNLSK
jgi:outer membrane immunogenic protein